MLAHPKITLRVHNEPEIPLVLPMAFERCLAMPNDHQKANVDTPDSQVVPHLGTNEAIGRLALEIERDPAFSSIYGRRYHISGLCQYDLHCAGA